MKITALFLAFAAANTPTPTQQPTSYSGPQTEGQRTLSNWGRPEQGDNTDGQVEDLWGTAHNDMDNVGNEYVRNGVKPGAGGVQPDSSSEATYGAREIAQDKSTDFDEFSQHHKNHVGNLTANDNHIAVDVEHFDEDDTKAIAETQGESATAEHTDQFDRVHSEEGYNNKTNDYNTHADYQDNTDKLHALLSDPEQPLALEAGYKYKHALRNGDALEAGYNYTQGEHDADYRNTLGNYSHGDFDEHGNWGIRENSKDKDSTWTSTHETGRGGDKYDAGVMVERHCVRRSDKGVPIEIVPYGWTGVGHGTKYCFLEVCNACSNAAAVASDFANITDIDTRLNSVGEDEHNTTEGRDNSNKYCEMVKKHTTKDVAAHSSDKMGYQRINANELVGPADGGACGIHSGDRATHKCEYVSCTYTNGASMEVTVKQGNLAQQNRTSGAHPENSPFQNGRKHECRPKYDGTEWSCTCNCYDGAAAPIIQAQATTQSELPSFSKNNMQSY
jgi:hypothetical protein